jgi:calcineurin-like phosphoesterase family protein
MTTYFTSDTHFGDPRVLRIDRRPFPDLATHDAALVENWNAVVEPDDTVWHLGDFALGPPPERVQALLSALNGQKHLIVGNNDGPSTLAAHGWLSTAHYAEIDVDGQHLVLCHYAFRTWNRMGRGVVNLHGHSYLDSLYEAWNASFDTCRAVKTSYPPQYAECLKPAAEPEDVVVAPGRRSRSLVASPGWRGRRSMTRRQHPDSHGNYRIVRPSHGRSNSRQTLLTSMPDPRSTESAILASIAEDHFPSAGALPGAVMVSKLIGSRQHRSRDRVHCRSTPR